MSHRDTTIRDLLLTLHSTSISRSENMTPFTIIEGNFWADQDESVGRKGEWSNEIEDEAGAMKGSGGAT